MMIVTDELTIQLAQPADKPQVLRILDELGEELNKTIGYSAHNAEAQAIGGPTFDAVMQRDDIKLFIATSNDKVIGLVSLYLLPSIRHGCTRGHIEDVVISEQSRGHGVGARLLEVVKEYCRTNGIKVIKLHSGNELVNAHRFYHKNGGRQSELMFRFDL